MNWSEPWRFTLLGYPAGFEWPMGLWVAGALLVGGLVLTALALRKSPVGRVVNARLLPKVAPGASPLRTAGQSLMTSLALGLFGFALAQPQCGGRAEQVKHTGIDVVVLLDASKSMLARDVAPSRLERAKLELTSLLDALKGDRVGIIAFAGEAFVQCPLTSDYAAAKLFLRAVEPSQMPQGGTNIGAALLLARDVFKGAERAASERVVVLLSDGEDLFGEVDEGVEAMKAAKAQVLAVGIGGEQGEPIPLYGPQGEVLGFQKDGEGNTVLTRLDRTGLSSIAEATGGRMFHQPRGVATAEVASIIDRMQKSEFESRIAMRYGEVFQPYLAAGVAFFILGMFLRPSRRRAP